MSLRKCLGLYFPLRKHVSYSRQVRFMSIENAPISKHQGAAHKLASNEYLLLTEQQKQVIADLNVAAKCISSNLCQHNPFTNLVQPSHIQPIIAPDLIQRIGITDPHSGIYSGKVILDPCAVQSLVGDPSPEQTDVIGDKTAELPAIQARHIQKIRRWHMNRHKLKRLRRRMLMVYRKRNYQRKKRKEKRLQNEMASIRLDGTNFDALAYVKEHLERAKRGGFQHSIWKSADEQPEVPWKEYTLPKHKIRRYVKEDK